MVSVSNHRNAEATYFDICCYVRTMNSELFQSLLFGFLSAFLTETPTLIKITWASLEVWPLTNWLPPLAVHTHTPTHTHSDIKSSILHILFTSLFVLLSRISRRCLHVHYPLVQKGPCSEVRRARIGDASSCIPKGITTAQKHSPSHTKAQPNLSAKHISAFQNTSGKKQE